MIPSSSALARTEEYTPRIVCTLRTTMTKWHSLLSDSRRSSTCRTEPAAVERPEGDNRNSNPESVVQRDRNGGRIVVWLCPKERQQKIIPGIRGRPDGSDLRERPDELSRPPINFFDEEAVRHVVTVDWPSRVDHQEWVAPHRRMRGTTPHSFFLHDLTIARFELGVLTGIKWARASELGQMARRPLPCRLVSVSCRCLHSAIPRPNCWRSFVSARAGLYAAGQFTGFQNSPARSIHAPPSPARIRDIPPALLCG